MSASPITASPNPSAWPGNAWTERNRPEPIPFLEGTGAGAPFSAALDEQLTSAPEPEQATDGGSQQTVLPKWDEAHGPAVKQQRSEKEQPVQEPPVEWLGIWVLPSVRLIIPGERTFLGLAPGVADAQPDLSAATDPVDLFLAQPEARRAVSLPASASAGASWPLTEAMPPAGEPAPSVPPEVSESRLETLAGGTPVGSLCPSSPEAGSPHAADSRSAGTSPDSQGLLLSQHTRPAGRLAAGALLQTADRRQADPPGTVLAPVEAQAPPRAPEIHAPGPSGSAGAAPLGDHAAAPPLSGSPGSVRGEIAFAVRVTSLPVREERSSGAAPGRPPEPGPRDGAAFRSPTPHWLEPVRLPANLSEHQERPEVRFLDGQPAKTLTSSGERTRLENLPPVQPPARAAGDRLGEPWPDEASPPATRPPRHPELTLFHGGIAAPEPEPLPLSRQDAAPRPATAPEAAPAASRESRRQGPIREISLHMPAEPMAQAASDRSPVSLRLRMRGEEVHVAVHAADPHASDRLRSELGSLADRLERAGLQGETWKPMLEAHSGAPFSRPTEPRADSGGDHSPTGSGRGGRGGDQRQHPRERPAWVEALEQQKERFS